MTLQTKLGIAALSLVGFLTLSGYLFKPFKDLKPMTLGAFFNFSNNWEFSYVDEKLNKIIKSHLDGKEGQYSVVIVKLNSEEKLYSLNGNIAFPAGSLYKLFLLSAAFEEIEKGRLKEDQEITVSQKHLIEVLGFEDFGYDPEQQNITHKVSAILRRIATISDNYASIMLAEHIGWEKVREQARILGASGTIIKSPISTTSSDIALYFTKLQKGEVVSKQSSEKIIELLSDSKLNTRIPAKLPETVDASDGGKLKLKIAHKTAELPDLRHNAGIVFLPNNPYVIVLFANEVTYEDDAIELLANISKDVFEYMKKKEN
jgi:beta-lactamase class A